MTNLQGQIILRWWNFPLGTFVFLVPFFSLLFTTLLWGVGLPLQRFVVIVAFFASYAFIYYFRNFFKLKKVEVGYIASCFLFLSGGGIALSALIYDYAYDGMVYHQPMVYALMHGWNPIYESHNPFFSGEYFSAYVDYYPKGQETMAAAFSLLLQNLEVGKVVNLLFLTSTFCFSQFFVTNYLGTKLTWWKNLLFTLVLSLSPVVVVQLFTYYVDGALYFIIIGLVAVLYDYVHRSISESATVDKILIGILIALAVSIKITVMFWSSVFLVLLLLFWKYMNRKVSFLSLFKSGLAGGVVGFAFLSFNPYMTNIQEGKCMFHPFLGDEAVDVYASQSVALEGLSRFEAVACSLTSRPNESDSYEGPFSLHLTNLLSSGKADVRLGGFGLFFFEFLVCSLFLFLSSCKGNRKIWCLNSLGLLVIFSFLLLLPNGWWARFVPFFYFFPLICVFFCLKYGSEFNRKGALLLCLLAMFNIGGCIASAAGLMFIHRSKMNYLLDVLSVSQQPISIETHNFAFIYKVKENRIKMVSADSLTHQLFYPGSPVYIDREQWNEDRFDKKAYFLLKYSNIKEEIAKSR